MGIYGSPSAKPHKAWSNDPALLREIHNRAGHISKAEMHSIKEAQQNALVKAAEKSNGKPMFSHSPRYYPPVIGKHFVQIALSLAGEREFLAGPCEPQVWTLSEMQSTDLELWVGRHSTIADWGDLWLM